MKFEDILDMYEGSVAYATRMLKVSRKSEDYWTGYRRAALNTYHTLLNFCDDFMPKRREPTDEEMAKHDNQGKEYPLVGVLEYRGETMFIYDDDYGQQYYGIYGNEVCPAGSFNADPDADFCYFLDECLFQRGR